MRTILALAVTMLVCGEALAQGTAGPMAAPAPPPSSDAQPSAAPASAATKAGSLPQDKHEGLTVSADPYTQPARSKDKFDKANPLPAGILPVEVFLRNETTHPFRVNMETIQLVVHPKNGAEQNIDWMQAQDAADAIAHPKGPSEPKQSRLPMGIGAGSDKKTEQFTDILQPLMLDADVLPPMGTLHGFLYFNLSHDLSLAEGASLYVPDVTALPAGKPLMFFEVVLSK